MGGKKWTPEEDAQVTEMLNNGIRPALVGKILGRSASAISQRYYELGNSRRKAFTRKMIDRNRVWREENTF